MMMGVSGRLRERATRLLALALTLHDDGRGDRAESFTAMAADCLDQAAKLEAAAHGSALEEGEPAPDRPIGRDCRTDRS